VPEGKREWLSDLLGRASRLVYRILAIGVIRPPLRLLLELTHRNQVPAVIGVPAAKTVLVIAPHMDDETIGCGGAILAHVSAGANVQVVFATDGTLGFSDETRRRDSPAQLAAVRRAEAEEACALLGVAKLHFLELPDGRSQADTDSVDRLRGVLQDVKPDLVYLPFITDSHPDHRTCNSLMFALLKSDSALSRLLCACYEVWTPLYPNSIVDITQHIDVKMAALACYDSQLALNNYLSSVRGLNAYRAIANNSQGFAEAFYLTTLGEYATLASLD
tara:strand:+ start:8834 stop:9661 length:828 start_codon:yes stop_codon:yes gene_type:complete